MTTFANGLQELYKKINDLVRQEIDDPTDYVPLLDQVEAQQAWFRKYGPEAKRLCNATKDVKDKDKAKETKETKKGKKAS